MADLQSVVKRIRERDTGIAAVFVGSNPTGHTKFYYK